VHLLDLAQVGRLGELHLARVLRATLPHAAGGAHLARHALDGHGGLLALLLLEELLRGLPFLGEYGARHAAPPAPLEHLHRRELERGARLRREPRRERRSHAAHVDARGAAAHEALERHGAADGVGHAQPPQDAPLVHAPLRADDAAAVAAPRAREQQPGRLLGLCPARRRALRHRAPVQLRAPLRRQPLAPCHAEDRLHEDRHVLRAPRLPTQLLAPRLSALAPHPAAHDALDVRRRALLAPRSLPRGELPHAPPAHDRLHGAACLGLILVQRDGQELVARVRHPRRQLRAAEAHAHAELALAHLARHRLARPRRPARPAPLLLLLPRRRLLLARQQRLREHLAAASHRRQLLRALGLECGERRGALAQRVAVQERGLCAVLLLAQAMCERPARAVAMEDALDVAHRRLAHVVLEDGRDEVLLPRDVLPQRQAGHARRRLRAALGVLEPVELVVAAVAQAELEALGVHDGQHAVALLARPARPQLLARGHRDARRVLAHAALDAHRRDVPLGHRRDEPREAPPDEAAVAALDPGRGARLELRVLDRAEDAQLVVAAEVRLHEQRAPVLEHVPRRCHGDDVARVQPEGTLDHNRRRLLQQLPPPLRRALAPEVAAVQALRAAGDTDHALQVHHRLVRAHGMEAAPHLRDLDDHPLDPPLPQRLAV
jgi:hypothetical protein